MPSPFDTFFQTATGGKSPYAYQLRLACGPDAKADEPTTLTSATACASQLISIPTGLGKTAAVVLAWLEPLLRAANLRALVQPQGAETP